MPQRTESSAHITKRGNSPTTTNDYEWGTMPGEPFPTPELMAEQQRLLGFPPAGYGNPRSITVTSKGRGFKATWSSSASCD